jgi:hypothetical protein
MTDKPIAELVELTDIDRDKTNDQLEAEENFRVGSIWHTSWGYDQTNVEYFQVVRESKASVWVREIAATVVDGRVYPKKDAFIGEVELHRKQSFGKGADRTDYLTIDYVRTAWAYRGGGHYDTLAAGQPGH